MKWITSVQLVAILALTATLSACGLGETATSSLAGAASQAQQAKQAQATERQVRQTVQADMRKAAAKQAAALKQAQ